MSMGPRSWTDAGFLLGDWEVRPRHGTVQQRGVAPPIQIEPRVMAVLACLARRAGEVVTRDEFVAEVWAGRVVSDEALSRCISLLRQVFADDSHEPRFIRTVARIGYTLLQTPAPLPPSDSNEPVITPPPAPAPEPGPPAPSPLRARVSRYAIAGVIAAAVTAAAISWYVPSPSRHVADSPPPPVTRLLVLPFDTREAHDFGRDVGNALGDEIADSLAHIERLRIIGRTSASAVAGTGAGAIEAGKRLGVDAVLDGAVAESPDGLRVTVRLATVSNSQVLWSRVYERKPADIFAVQSSIASAIVRELVGLLSRDALAGVPSIEPDSRDLQAYQLYLRGAHQVRLRGEDSLRRAVDLFSAALRRDPTYTRAQLALANAYALLPSYTFEDPAEMYALADKALARAEVLAHSRSVTAGTRAYLGFVRSRWVDAEIAFRTAIASDPNNPDVRQLYSQLLGAVGRLDAAFAQARLAQELDPLAPVVADRIGILQLWLGQDEEAARNEALARELGLDEVAYPETRVLLKLHQHADADAANALRDLQHAVNRSDAWIEPTLHAYRDPAARPAAIEMLDHAQKSGAISARIYFGAMVLLAAPERAMRAFTSLVDRDPNDLEFLFSTDAASIRRDPGFGAFVERMGLVTYWDRFGWPSACRREGPRIACH